MLYGHSRNGGHGWRRPSYQWTPFYVPGRPRRGRKRSGKRRGRRPRPYSEPEVTLVELLFRYPSLAQPPSNARLTLDPVKNLADFTAFILASCVPFLLVYWQATLALGITALLARRILRQTRWAERKFTTLCEQASKAYRINRKTSVNPPPTAEALEAAWKATRGGRRGDPEVLAARLRLGAMLSDLEPVVDQSYIRDVAGTIVGRQPGLRGWIAMHAPDLLPYYKTLMAYKSLADKLRTALGIEEPDTLDGVLELGKQVSKISVSEPEEREAGEEAETAGKGVRLREGFTITVKSREKEIREAYRELFADGFPVTMADLEAIVRGRLGLAWMRRKRRRPVAA
jgi:hypothetical protein